MSSADRSLQTRSALLDGAKRLFGDFGYARTSHADIAVEADIGRTTFYEHFASKEDLLVQLVQRDLPALIDEIVDSQRAAIDKGQIRRFTESRAHLIDNKISPIALFIPDRFLATVQRQGYVRLFSTGLRGELGSEIEVVRSGATCIVKANATRLGLSRTMSRRILVTVPA